MVYSDLSYAYKRLQDTLGAERVSRDDTEKLVYGHDFGPLPKQAAIQFELKPDIITLPKSTQEVVRILELGRELEIPVVPRGGATSFHGGCVPNVGGILLCTNLMRKVEEVDDERLCVTAQAGATWKDVIEAVSDAGLFLPVVPMFYRSATVGGFLSNGGVGIGAYKYGAPSQWVRSLEVVLPNGQILGTGERSFDLGSLNYNLTSLFLGAEGTLGVIAKATLRLLPKPGQMANTAYSFEGMGGLAEALKQLARTPVTPYHVGFVDGAHLLLQRTRLRQLPDVPAMAILTFDGSKEEIEAERKAADDTLSSLGKREEDESASILWEHIYEPYDARRISGGLVVAEGVVPLSNLEKAVQATIREARRIRAEPAFHGFLVDRGSAFLAPYILTDERTLRGQLAISFVERYHKTLMDLDGHPFGLGLLTTYNLDAMYGSVAGHMRAIKEALDPKAIVNRGKLLGTTGKTPPFAPPEIPAGLIRRGLRTLGNLRKLMPSDRYISRLRRGK
ncbi:MAG: FAD-binding oxidoreductase [Thermoplasmata archaeon]